MGVAVGVRVAVPVAVAVEVEVGVAVGVAVAVEVEVAVAVPVDDGVGVNVAVGLAVGIGGVLTPFSVERGSEATKVEKLASGTALRLFVVFSVGVLFAGLMYRSFTVILPAFLESLSLIHI